MSEVTLDESMVVELAFENVRARRAPGSDRWMVTCGDLAGTFVGSVTGASTTVAAIAGLADERSLAYRSAQAAADRLAGYFGALHSGE